MDKPSVQRSLELLGALLMERVEFVVVGGDAAIAHGSLQFTQDLDVVSPLTADNCGRILKALSPFEPRFYQTQGKPRVHDPPSSMPTAPQRRVRSTRSAGWVLWPRGAPLRWFAGSSGGSLQAGLLRSAAASSRRCAGVGCQSRLENFEDGQGSRQGRLCAQRKPLLLNGACGFVLPRANRP